MHRRVDHDRVRLCPGHPPDRSLAAVVRAVVCDDEYLGGTGVGFVAHNLAHQRHERGDPGGLRAGRGYLSGAHVECGQQRQRAGALVLVLHSCRPAAPGRPGGVAASAGLDGGLGVNNRDDPVPGTQWLALVETLVQVEDHGGPGGEVRVAGKEPGLVTPGLEGMPGQDPQHR